MVGMSECPFPSKKAHTRQEARYNAQHINTYSHDGRAVSAYHCPAGGHWHVGHRPRKQAPSNG